MTHWHIHSFILCSVSPFPICLVSLTLSLSLIKAMATVAAAAARRAAALTRLSSPQTSSPHLIHRRGLAGAAGNFFALTFISIYIYIYALWFLSIIGLICRTRSDPQFLGSVWLLRKFWKMKGENIILFFGGGVFMVD